MNGPMLHVLCFQLASLAFICAAQAEVSQALRHGRQAPFPWATSIANPSRFEHLAVGWRVATSMSLWWMFWSSCCTGCVCVCAAFGVIKPCLLPHLVPFNVDVPICKARWPGLISAHVFLLQKFEALRDSRGNSIAEELRCLMATLEIELLMLHVSTEPFTQKMGISLTLSAIHFTPIYYFLHLTEPARDCCCSTVSPGYVILIILWSTKVNTRGAEISSVKLLVVMFAAPVTRSTRVFLLFLKVLLSVKTQINPRICVTAAQICLLEAPALG